VRTPNLAPVCGANVQDPLPALLNDLLDDAAGMPSRWWLDHQNKARRRQRRGRFWLRFSLHWLDWRVALQRWHHMGLGLLRPGRLLTWLAPRNAGYDEERNDFAPLRIIRRAALDLIRRAVNANGLDRITRAAIFSALRMCLHL